MDIRLQGTGRYPVVLDGFSRYAVRGELSDTRAWPRRPRSFGNPTRAATAQVPSTRPYVCAADPAGMPLTPVAAMEGCVVAHNLLSHKPRTVDCRGLPTVVYTVPPLASVGLSEAAARAAAAP